MDISLVGIVAIVGWVIVSVADSLADKKRYKKTREDKQRQQQLEEELAQLKERVAVLEKIVTDPKNELREKFRHLA